MISRIKRSIVQLPLLTQSIGSAERSMRALLERNMREADLSFPAWTALVFTNSSPLTSEQVAQRQIGGHVVASMDEAQQEINKIIQAGLTKMNEGGALIHTDKGAAVFPQVSRSCLKTCSEENNHAA